MRPEFSNNITSTKPPKGVDSKKVEGSKKNKKKQKNNKKVSSERKKKPPRNFLNYLHNTK